MWQPLHVERGFQPSDSTVTVHAGSSPYHIGSSGNTAEGILDTICHSISALGPPSAEIVLVFSLEHMKTIARDGFSRSDIQAYIHQHTKRLPEDVIIVVAGGPAGQWTVAIPRWGGPTHSVTKRIEV